MRAAFEVRPGLGDWPKEGHECAYENGDGICRECAALAELEKVRSRIEQAVTEHYTGDDLWIATSLAARALLARATAPQATNDPMAVVRLKAICKLLGLERAIPVGTYADPEGLFVIFGMMRSKIETLHCATRTPIYQIGANAGGGIAWWDVDKDRYEREKKAGYMKTGIVYREGQ